MFLNQIKIHPDDVLFFNEVVVAMRTLAKRYHLPLKSVTGGHMPAIGVADFLGKCHHNGDIEIVLRATVDGEFCEHPISPAQVWETVAHELAHLKHFNHGKEFDLFRIELLEALDMMRKPDHRQRVIDKLVKMQASRQSEAELGNSAAAEAFAAAINRMMIENELHPSDLDYARAADNDPIIEMRVNLDKYHIETKRTRVAWQESLARIVARAHLCSFLLQPGSNNIWFVGTRSHALVAEYVFGTIVPLAAKMSYTEYRAFRRSIKPINGKYERPETHGFIEAWLYAFTKRIAERFDDARKQAVADITQQEGLPLGSESQALIRLDGAMTRVRTYIDDKFKSSRSRGAHALSSGRSSNAEGARRGTAAANAMTLGRKGLTSSKSSTKLLK